MTSSGRIFFAGVGTTFVILTIGFGAGLMLAKASIEPSARSYSSAEPLPPVRVILPRPLNRPCLLRSPYSLPRHRRKVSVTRPFERRTKRPKRIG